MSVPALHLGGALGVACLALFAFAAWADATCNGSGEPYVFDARKSSMGPAHHPVGRPLPATQSFNSPTHCVDGLWFFDQNGNAQPDAGEIRLFGPQRAVDCGSCHGDSPEPKSAQSASVFLRQDASRLCLVCHRM